MFRFEGNLENACAGSTEIKAALKKWKKWFKWLEFLAGLTSFIGLVAILFLWMVRGVDISSVPADRLQMETWWKVDRLAHPDVDAKNLPTWKRKYETDENRILEWMVYSNYDGLLNHEGVPSGAPYETKKEVYRPKVQLYDDFKYPGTIWLYDVASFFFNVDDQVSQSGFESVLTSMNEAMTQARLPIETQPVTAPTIRRRLLHSKTAEEAQMHSSSIQFFFDATRAGLDATCDHKQKPFKQLEHWDGEAYSGMDVPINAYRVSLWSLLLWIYLVSVLFQWWRAWNYETTFRPVGPEPMRWLEYLLSSPLMLMIVAMSAMIRDATTVVLLVFLQVALIMLGYMLEIMIDEYLTYVKYGYFAKVYGMAAPCGETTSATIVNSTAKPSIFNLQAGEACPRSGPCNKPSVLGGPPRTQKPDESSALKNELIDLFLVKTFDPNRLSCMAAPTGNMITTTINRYSSQIRFIFFMAFSCWGVTWTVILARLIRQGHIMHDCVCHADACPAMPSVVWAIVIGQMVAFVSFGLNLAYMWQFSLKGVKKNFHKPENLEDTELKQGLIDSVSTQLGLFKTQIYEAWVRTAFIFSVLNFASKLYLELTILWYVTTYRMRHVPI